MICRQLVPDIPGGSQSGGPKRRPQHIPSQHEQYPRHRRHRGQCHRSGLLRIHPADTRWHVGSSSWARQHGPVRAGLNPFRWIPGQRSHYRSVGDHFRAESRTGYSGEVTAWLSGRHQWEGEAGWCDVHGLWTADRQLHWVGVHRRDFGGQWVHRVGVRRWDAVLSASQLAMASVEIRLSPIPPINISANICTQSSSSPLHVYLAVSLSIWFTDWGIVLFFKLLFVVIIFAI